MSTVFIKLLNMSITASWMILAVILARLLLKKAPKWITCLLWGLVAVRLICPFSFESIFSLIPSSQTIPSNIALQQEPAINSGITIVNETINPIIAESFTPTPSNSANPLQIIIPVASIIWIVGIVILLAYALISYLRLKKSVSVCVSIKEGILSCDEVKAPFILGVFRPIIYVPSSMNGETLDYVLRHESAHLQRRDHWWKPLGFLLLSVYWFNPLCWIAYILLCRDIEMACDEKVIRDMDKGDMAAYSQALLDCSFPRKRIAACPLAFGEVGVKERIKGVLNYKKPAFWIILIAIIACVVLAVCLMTDPSSGRKISFGNVQLSWAKALDLRPNEQTTRDLTEDELEELKSRLAVLKIGKRDDDLVGFTPFYSLSVYASQTGQFLIASFDYEGNNIGIMYQNHYYRIHDDSFADYLSKVCAGNITVDSPFEAEIDVASLKAKYPEYFDLDTFKGLEVYVWQMASDSYSFGVMSGTNREKTLEELMSLKGASLEEMRIILSTYDIAQEDVSIIPWQNPISSYLGEYGMIWENEDPASAEKRIKEYVERIRQMLFGNAQDGGYDLPNHIIEIKTTVAYANWTEGEMMQDCLNGDKMLISSVRHLPVYKLDTKEDLKRFIENYKDTLTLDQGYGEVPSFNDVTASYDDNFFADHTIVIAYVAAGSGSVRYAIQSVSYGESAFCLDVVQTNNPGTYTDDMVGWFVIAEVLDSDITGYTEFDAQLVNIRTDVCELYLDVLEDLWNVDSGLNSGISQIGIDLSELSHLTELEKETVMHEFASKHNLPFIAGTWEELCEQGYIDKDNLYWEDGLFFSIKTNKDGDSALERTTFDAQKWRSGLGAYFFDQCTAQKNADGKWSYTVGRAAIS